jgi:hypothetical protein
MMNVMSSSKNNEKTNIIPPLPMIGKLIIHAMKAYIPAAYFG